MKRLFLLLAAVSSFVLCARAQSMIVHENNSETTVYNVSGVDSVTFSCTSLLPEGAVGSTTIEVAGNWCSVGTSITWYNDNVSYAGGAFTRGYQDRVMDKIHFKKFYNVGVNGGTLSSAYNSLVRADYYTVEHGINDWGHAVKPGSFEDDYIGQKDKNTFAYEYRRLIDRIFKVNKNAKVVLCTPRKAYGFGTYLPAHWYDPMKASDGTEIYLKEYADLIRQIAEYEGFPVADWFAECGGDHDLAAQSIDVALHPNDIGYQRMANVLIQALQKVLIK